RSDLRTGRAAEDEAARRDRLHARGDVHQSGALQARLDAGRELQPDLYGLDVSAEGLRRMAGADLAVGASFGRALRRAGSRELVLGSVERAGHRLLARHARGVLQTVRLRGGRLEARAARGQDWRTDHDQPQRPARAGLSAELSRALRARYEL